MIIENNLAQALVSYIGSGLVFLLLSSNVFAHCDTLEGPVVNTARIALESGDVTPLLKWVPVESEEEIKLAFDKTIAVRSNGKEAQELADMYFFETLVRIHRAGEGVAFTGLKPGEAIDPAVALADKALDSGSVDKLVDVLTKALAKGIRERFYNASAAQKYADDSIEKGREFVENYVYFTHYVEGLHAIIKGGGGHHGSEAEDHSSH